MSDPVAPEVTEALQMLAYEAAIENRFDVRVQWIDNGGPEGAGAWRCEVDGETYGEDANLYLASEQALHAFRITMRGDQMGDLL